MWGGRPIATNGEFDAACSQITLDNLVTNKYEHKTYQFATNRIITGTHILNEITQRYVPPGTGDIHAFTPAN